MSSNTKERLLSDLEALRHQLAEIEAYGSDNAESIPTLAAIPTLEVDNIPLLGDAVPADRNEAIAAHREAMAKLDAELRELDNAEQIIGEPANDAASDDRPYAQTIATNNATAETAPAAATTQQMIAAEKDNPTAVFATAKQAAETLLSSHLKAYAHPMATPTGSDENPFLPQHLRERLDKSKSSLLEEIARSSESLDASTALLRNFSGEPGKSHSTQAAAPMDHQVLVDTLVAKYLPLIEADLRQRLNTSLQQQLAAQQKMVEPSH